MSGWPPGAVAFVQAIADTKLVLGHRYAQWSLAGPTLEDDIGGASAAQEEIGHVRQLFRLLSEQGRDEAWLNGDRDAGEFNNAACLDSPGESWPAHVASVAPADRAAWYLLDAIDHDDFGGMVQKMGEDEYFHLEYHDARLETLAEEAPDALEGTLERTLPAALAFLGPATYDEATDPLVEADFTDRPVADIREAYADHYRGLFADTPVSLAGVDWDAPDPEAWDESRRRVGDGGLDDDDLRQLRGEDNAMFAMD